MRLDPVPLGLPLGFFFAFSGGWLGLWSLKGTWAGIAWVGFTMIWAAVFLIREQVQEHTKERHDGRA